MKKADEITGWLISEGRILGDGAAVVAAYASRLVNAGVPLSRMNISQRFANPLLIAWGVIWTPEGCEEYDVTHAMLDTDSYIGSPVEYVLVNEKPLHKSLAALDPDTSHSSYLELAVSGGKDFYGSFLEYGDGFNNVCTFVTNDSQGFTPEHIKLFHNTRHGLASAMEPVTMRRSTESLLRAYIGHGPARAVCEGTIKRGEHESLNAVVMFTDLRGFTAKSEKWDDTRLLEALNGYFDVVVQSVEEHGGDVLKFMGDGILSIFKIDDEMSLQAQCKKAAGAARTALAELDKLNKTRATASEESLAMGIGINVGSVTYGNIGSPGRLDFTVLGSAVNVASRVQDLCKIIEEPVLATKEVATHCKDAFMNQGNHFVSGVDEPIEVFSLRR